MAELLPQLPGVLSELAQAAGGASEFHFTDIYAGKRAFENVSPSVRLALFRFMSAVFEYNRFPVFVQTMDPDTLRDLRSKFRWPEAFGPLRVSRHEDFALVFLLMRVRAYLQSLPLAGVAARVFVDEGRLKNGVAFGFPKLAPTFRDGLICFANSKVVLPLQLADFAAFVLNRWQLLRQKSSLTRLDKEFLAIVSPVSQCFENIERVSIQNLPNISKLKDGMH